MAIKPSYGNLHLLPLSERKKIWTGCHGDGMCRPCGQVHNFAYQRTGAGKMETVDRFHCSYNMQRGCPREIPAPVHTWVNGKCSKCGVKAQYVAPNGTKHRTIANGVRYGGCKRSELVREDQKELMAIIGRAKEIAKDDRAEVFVYQHLASNVLHLSSSLNWSKDPKHQLKATVSDRGKVRLV